MKKKLLLGLLMLSLVAILSSCAGAGDWRYDLSGEYSIWRINSRSIVLCQNDVEDGEGIHVIEEYVSEIAYNDNYIFAKQLLVPEDAKEKFDTSNPSYYILIVENGELYGPYTENEFKEKCAELRIEAMPKWIKTTKLKQLNKR